MAFAKHCGARATAPWQDDYTSAPIAPAPWQTSLGRARTRLPSMPPKAATASPPRRASRLQRATPKAAPPGWLSVGNAGDRNARSTPVRAARRSCDRSCAELVAKAPRPRGAGPRPPRRCTPAPSDAASRRSPATTRASRRLRQILARSRPSRARSGAPSWRRTTPHSPRGNRATAARGSGSRAASVNSHNTGRPFCPGRKRCRDLTARAQATSF